jgi:hypothetical protein
MSHRRSDNPDATGRIYDRLVAEFGKALVAKDVDSSFEIRLPLARRRSAARQPALKHARW